MCSYDTSVFDAKTGTKAINKATPTQDGSMFVDLGWILGGSLSCL